VIAEPAPPAVAAGYASFAARAGAHLLDVGVPVFGLLVIARALARYHHSALPFAVAALGVLVIAVSAVWNTVFRQGATGQSLGKRAARIRLVGESSGQPIGAGRTLVRQVAHLLDALPLHVGYLWPLWDERRQTFADKACATTVVRVEG
jgi:uncharacterized RDD family membrane protein YckC